ncbi:MAG: HEAT repeat domain-containing protein [Myxococcales bacterium]|nr:HEAT repeat domain-containing protein [Myxococcales bacterium]HQY61752.1 hypothetical protein [Polyangiaceae bacterium]
MLRARRILAAVCLLALSRGEARAQDIATLEEMVPAPERTASNLRGRFGMELVLRLVRSREPEDRLRGLRRAADIATPEALALIASQVESNAAVRADPRALIEAARGLAPHAHQDGARTALLAILTSPPGARGARSPASGAEPGASPAEQVELARATAALALAESGNGAALEALLNATRTTSAASAAAADALALAPPATLRGLGTARGLTAPLLLAVSRTEDLRAGDVLLLGLAAADPRVKGLALLELARKGDERALPAARELAKKGAGPAPLRIAAVQALAALGAHEATDGVKALLEDEGAAPFAVDLVPRLESDDLVKHLAARASLHPLHAQRLAAIGALSRCRSVAAAKALGALVLDKSVESEAAHALGRMRSAAAVPWLIAMLRSPEARRLGARAYVVHVLAGGAPIDEAKSTLRTLSASRATSDRAVGVFARVALGDAAPESHLSDPDPSVRAAAAMGCRGRANAAVHSALLARAVDEKHPAARSALLAALASGDPSGKVPSVLLVDRAESGEPEAPLAAFVLARRTKERASDKVRSLATSATPLVATYALRGLAESEALDASGWLASAYAYEPDAQRRSALVAALAARHRDARAPVRAQTLNLAARLDPSPEVRSRARQALRGSSPVAGEATEVAWLRVTGPDGRAPADTGHAATLVTSAGEAVPIAFDPDGYAVVLAVPPGDTHLLLAPRFTTEGPTK